MRVLSTKGEWEQIHTAGIFDTTVTWPTGDIRRDGIPVNGGSIPLVSGPGGQQASVSYRTVFETNPWLWAAVNTIARGLSRLELRVYNEQDDGSLEEVRPFASRRGRMSATTRLARTLRYPGARATQSRRALWFETAVDKLVEGNAFWEIERQRDSEASSASKAELLGFTWHQVENVTLNDPKQVYRLGTSKLDGKSERNIIPEDACHFGRRGEWGPSPSPIASLQATLTLYNAVVRQLIGFFENGARISGHLQVDRTTGKPARELIREELTKLYASPENAGRILVTSGNWQPNGAAPSEAAVIDLIKLSREEVAAAYSIPPPMIGILDRAIMSNVRELRDQYVRDLIGPHAEFLEADFEAQVIDLDPRLEGVAARFDLDEQLRPDLEARAKTFRDKRLVYSLNELRKPEGLPRIEDPAADVPWVQINEVPIDAWDDKPEAPAPQPAAPAPNDNETPEEEDDDA